MFFQMLWLMFASFIAGGILGVLVKGIHINVNHKHQEEAPEEFNLVDETDIPEEYRIFLEKSKGIIE